MESSKKNAVTLEGTWLKNTVGTQEEGRLLVKVKCESKKSSKKSKTPLHLSFALDCSGSMNEAAGQGDSARGVFNMVGGNAMMNVVPGAVGAQFVGAGGLQNPAVMHFETKMEACKNALKNIVKQLHEEDYASLTLFSSGAQVVFESAPMSPDNKEKLCALVSGVYASGSTALLEGWALAAKQCVGVLEKKMQARVILLTDGNATTESNIDVICNAVTKISQSGVSTSCFGVGAHFNEDLLMQMSQKGAGNFRYIPDAHKATQEIALELQSFDNLLSSKTYLRAWVEQNGGSTQECQVLGLECVNGQVQIGQLLHGNTLEYVICAPKLAAQEAKLHVEVTWQSKKGVQKQVSGVFDLKVVNKKKSASATVQSVQDAIVLQEASIQKKNIAKSIETGNWAAAKAQLGQTQMMVSSMMSKDSGSFAQESADLSNLEKLVAQQNSALGRKEALYQSYARSVNQNVLPRSDKPE